MRSLLMVYHVLPQCVFNEAGRGRWNLKRIKIVLDFVVEVFFDVAIQHFAESFGLGHGEDGRG